jgi:DNA segregation ATPase FtsK/SpoIIIE, S-DNA-T family
VRLLLSAASEIDGAVVDLAVECADDATVADVARQLARLVGPKVAVVRDVGRRFGVVTDDEQLLAGPGSAQPPALYVRGRQVDPAQRVADSPLRNGVLVGVGGCLPDVLAEPGGVVEVRTVSGRGAGQVDRLAPGRYLVGPGPGCAIKVEGARLPEVAVRLDVELSGAVTVSPELDVVGATVPPPARVEPLAGPIVIPKQQAPNLRRRLFKRNRRILEELDRLKSPHHTIDPDADRPLVHLDRIALDQPTVWEAGSVLVLGDVMLELQPLSEPDASLSPSPGGVTVDYNRPPRLLPPPRSTSFRLPTEPRKPDKPPIPFVLVIAPVLLGVTMYLITRSPLSLVIMALSPVMMISNYVTSNRWRKRRYTDELRTYVERIQRIEGQAYAALVAERAARRTDLPDPAALLLFATGPRARLWERRRTDPDWLLARVGTADLASEVTLLDPAREEHERSLAWTAPDVPVGIVLAEVGVTGIAGETDVRRRVGGWLVAQAATLHSPADLDIVVLSDPAGGPAWNWVRWLPHVRQRDRSDVLAGVGADDETIAGRISELLAVVESRKAALAEGGGLFARHGPAFPPLLVVLDGARRLRLLPGLISLLQDGPGVGLVFLCLDADERQLPEECRAVVALGPEAATVRVTGRATIDGVRIDLVTASWCERLARALAPVRDVSSEDLSSALPSSSRLLDVLHLDPPTAEAVSARWVGGGRTTRAVIGETVDGPFAVDIRTDGPHGLVAGTTGSGKSELLQTLIASLAVGNRPDEMTFVLIDYKGGAAFKDCNRLPHTVGMVTDLDAHLTTRALESLGAELRRREHQLARAGAKDIEDYLAARDPDDEPMPRLMIVIDEFAALVADLPAFVTGLVDIARRGRSLGVHLILATQRPAGVVSAEIKSNTNLRIALRVTDRNDSQDVIESPDAAEISNTTPGRAFARLGHSSLVPFQSARIGGRTTTGSDRSAVAVRQLSWETLGRAVPDSRAEPDADDVHAPTDLAELVAAISRAAESTGVTAPPSPWLPPLPDLVTLDDLEALPTGSDAPNSDIELPLGLVDLPREQRRTVATFNVPRSGHLAVIGAPRTGRSTVLRALAGALGRQVSPRDVHLFGVDCGNNALLPMIGLPHTGAVVTRDQPDRLARLTARIRAEIGRRQQLLAQQGFADLREQRTHAADEERLPYLLVLFDRWEGFVSAFENYDSGTLIDQWLQIMQEGAGVGVKVVVTADRSGLVGRLSTLVDTKLMLRTTEVVDYNAIGMSPRAVPTHMPPGRGFLSDGLRETQVALLAEDPAGTAQVAAIQEIARKASDQYLDVPRSARPFRVDPLPTRVSFEEALTLADRTPAATELPLAVGGDTLGLRSLDAIENGPGLLVLGPRRAGRSTALVTMATAASDRGWRLVLLTPRRSPLRDLAGRSGVDAVLTLESGRDDVQAAVDRLAPAAGSVPTALFVDDVELVGVDGWLADTITAHLGRLRDSGSVLVAAGTTDDLGSAYRGPVAALKKSRSGLLLSPATPNDGDMFGIRLPRSVTGGMPPGRGLLVTSGQWELVQVAARDVV